VNSTTTGVKSQILRLLNDDAKIFFQYIIDPVSIGEGKQHTVNVIGDIDGSVARMVLSAVLCGYINITNRGLESLTSLMNDEAKVLHIKSRQEADDFYVKFQGNATISQELEVLVSELSYSESDQELVYIGDTAFDRFACNQLVSLEIREKLHEKGVIFILGNHDIHPFDTMNPQFAYYSVKKISKNQWDEH
ncbi:hypothetical protein NLN82_28375, partial [Citrobacter portucalensis]|uniref:hypothetical protein n=1 Tax=Citrobacter portucalensis TaxID=1639133 RepID=UPI00226B884C